jgi:hypothetical protein
MHTYRAFDLNIQSSVPLSDLPGTRESPNVLLRQRRITAASLAEWHDGGDHIGALIGEGRFRFRVERGTAIDIDWDQDFAAQGMIPTIILGVILASLLRQRDLLVLHASVVARDGTAIAFLGDSGWGKSTLGEYFCQRGYTLLSDDILAIEFGAGTPRAIPGFPQVKLRPDAGAHLRQDYDTLPELYSEGLKRVHLPTDRFAASACPLGGVFVLENRVAQRNELVSIPAAARLQELIRHTRIANLFTDARYRQRHLEQCSELIRRVPVRLLKRVRDLNGLPEIFDLVDGTLAASDNPVHAVE